MLKYKTNDLKEANDAATSDVDRPRKISCKRKVLFICLSSFIGLLVAAVLGETVFRVLEAKKQSHSVSEGTAFSSASHERWGWALKPGKYRKKTSEFDTSGYVNKMWMNDGQPYDGETDKFRTRVLVLGDSHTAAIGASTDETWVKVLERRLNEANPQHHFRCYNASAVGYSLHQYLLRLTDQGPVVKPHYVVVGYSFATDLYDLLPPERGGWIYGGNNPRAYYDLDEATGELVEKYWDPTKTNTENVNQRKVNSAARSLRAFLGNFATFRYLRRSQLALTIGAHLGIGGQSLWPNMDVVLEKQISDKHKYQWDLNNAILERINEETQKLGGKLVIVGIPYLPQVYDEIWDGTFGEDQTYSRTAATERLAAWCEDHDITYVETLDALREQVKSRGHWLHYRDDAHPNADGHEVIAETIYTARLITPIEP